MKSIRRSFLIFTVATIVSLCLIMGCVGAFFLVARSDEDANVILSLTCAKESSDIDLLLDGVETAVQDEVSCIVDDIRAMKKTGQSEWRNTAERLFGNIASHTNGAVLYCAHVDANKTLNGDMEAFCYYRTNTTMAFTKWKDWAGVTSKIADASLGWDEKRLEKGIALWLEPIDLENNGTQTELFLAPVMVDGEYCGYVAMGIDFSVIQRRVAAIRLYDNGYAFLVDSDANVMYHPDFGVGSNLKSHTDEEAPQVDAVLAAGRDAGDIIAYKYRGEEKRMAFFVLRNSMRLVMTANATEIYRQRNELVAVLVLIGVFAILISVFMTMRQVDTVLTPLRNLTKAAERAAQGDVDVRILAPNVMEVRELAKAYNKTVDRMRSQIELIDQLARRDQLTGLQNRTAFYEETQALDARIAAGEDVRFDVVMFDVNDLKPVNDEQGHDAGDALLRRAATFLSHAFEGYDVYRIGGDEFVLVCEGELDDVESRMDSGDVSIAWGKASYRAGEDAGVSAVVGRADVAMYDCKRRMKSA